MRVATFNVLHGRSPEDGLVDLDRFAGAVAALDADLLALQEVDRDQPRSHGADLTAVAAAAMGAQEHRFAATMSGLPEAGWRAATGGEPAGTPAYGVALLSRLPVLAWQVVRLPRMPVAVPVLFPGRRRPVLAADEPRLALLAQVQAPEGRIDVAATHLSFLPGWNVLQLRRLSGLLCGRARTLLMGDLNMTASPAARTSRMQPVADGATFPAHAPARQLDHILVRGVRPPARPGAALRLPLSDHQALVADLPG